MTEVIAESRLSRFHHETITHDTQEVDLQGVFIEIGSETLLAPSRLILKAGCHYCLIGRNGVGKSTLLKCIGERKLTGFPKNISVLYVEQEQVVLGDEGRGILQAVLDADEDRVRIEQELDLLEAASQDSQQFLSTYRDIMVSYADDELNDATQIATQRSGARGRLARNEQIKSEEKAKQAKGKASKKQAQEDDDYDLEKAHELLTQLYEKISLLDPEESEKKATKILLGLGFRQRQLTEPVSSLSGGWRMRLALARGLFMNPQILLLDEPTNHLDMPSVLWLVDYLNKQTEQTMVIVTHDRYLMTEVADEMIIFRDKQLKYHPGNYTSYEMHTKQRAQWKMNMYEAIEKKKDHIRKTIQKQYQIVKNTGDDKRLNVVASRKKKLERMGMEKTEDGKRFKVSYRAGYHFDARVQVELEKPEEPVHFKLPVPPPLRYKGPVLQVRNVSFNYKNSKDPKDMILNEVTMDITTKSRIAVLGANGSGKSTLLNLITGVLTPTVGTIERFSGLTVGHFTQHHVDALDFTLTPLRYFLTLHPELKEQEARGYLGGFGISGALATQLIGTLSGGQKTRLSLAIMLYSAPHILILDEVTNHMDLQSIEGLEDALRSYQGGIVVVGHDIQFIESIIYKDEEADPAEQPDCAVYVVALKKLNRWNESLSDYVFQLQTKRKEAAKKQQQLQQQQKQQQNKTTTTTTTPKKSQTTTSGGKKK